MSHITYVERQSLDKLENAVIVQGVNCMGGYGAGFSGFLARKWPEVEKAYRRYFADGKIHFEYIGTTDFVEVDEGKNLFVANGFTQEEMAKYAGHVVAKPQAIQQVLNQVIKFAETSLGGLNIYMPKIGAGLGGLSWEKDVLPIIETAAAKAELEGIRFHVVEFFE